MPAFLKDLPLRLDDEELGVVLVALATLHGFQKSGRAHSAKLGQMERDYVDATDRVSKKICAQLGLPDSYLHDLVIQTNRELMRVIK